MVCGVYRQEDRNIVNQKIHFPTFFFALGDKGFIITSNPSIYDAIMKMDQSKVYADSVINNANVITLDPTNSHSEAIAIKYGRILKVGTNSEILNTIGSGTRIVDLKGKTVLPGFIDSHVHLADFGLTLKTLNLEGVQSITEVLKLLESRVNRTAEGEWVMGRGWNEYRFEERRLLNRWDLDRVSPNNPVYLHHYTCHACVVNSRGLDVAKIDRTTKPPEGGWIDRDPETGEPTGFLRSNARMLVPVGLNGYRPRPGYEGLLAAIKIGTMEAVKAGLTGMHVASADQNDINICQRLAKTGDLPLRVTLMPRVELLPSLLRLGICTGFGDEWVRLGAIKIFSDGSLIAHTAAMSQPFEGELGNIGLLRDRKTLTQQMIEANRAGMQIAVHACGDRAVETTIDIFEAALEDTPDKDPRHRIEHGSIIPQRLVKQIKELGIVISTQPELVTKFGDIFRSSLGHERMRDTYAYKSLMEAGIVLSGSSDCPLTPCSPLKGIQAAITRISENTGETIFEKERISLDDAVRMYTVNAAYAGFEENLKGSIEKGKLADLTVLSKNPWEVQATQIGGIEIEMTIVGGKIIYRR